MKNIRLRLLDEIEKDKFFQQKNEQTKKDIRFFLSKDFIVLPEVIEDELLLDIVNNFDKVCKEYKVEKTLLEKKHEIFEKQVKRLEVSLCQDMQTGAYIKGQYVSDFNRFQSMEMQNTPPGQDLLNSELDYLTKRNLELNDLIETIREDQKLIMNSKGYDSEVNETPPNNEYLERLERVKSMVGKSVLYFPAMGSTLLHIWSLLQDDIETAKSKFDSMRSEVEDLLVESGTIERDKLEEAKSK